MNNLMSMLIDNMFAGMNGTVTLMMQGQDASPAQAVSNDVMERLSAVVATVDACSICHDDFIKGYELTRMLPCGHLFHAYCIREWLQRKDSCPVCREFVSAYVPVDTREDRDPLRAPICGFDDGSGRPPCAVEDATSTRFLRLGCGCIWHLDCLKQWVLLGGGQHTLLQCPKCHTPMHVNLEPTKEPDQPVPEALQELLDLADDLTKDM